MNELPKAYDAKKVDAKWYEYWENKGFFKANPHSKKPPYCIVMPPPNVTGALHMGHALVSTLQDILIRWKRMNGYEALWVPGTDHAGISTQTVVERHLMHKFGKRRQDFSREDFLSYVWAWKEEKETNILNQLRRVGCSCDWSRLRFTMDAQNNRAVRVMFKKLYDANLIYKGDYLVNWDPVTQTAIADDEVEYEEKQSFLWYLKYPLKDGSDFIRVATTRPETMLGDTAVAISPRDPRAHSLVGKIVMLPLMQREISIIADPQVDMEFGAGMVKVTPAHDPNDYQMGIAHNLPFINIMTPDGKINANGGGFEGLTMEEARKAVVKKMTELGLLEKTVPHLNRVGISYRSKAVIEPYISKQWFIRMEGLAEHLKSAVQNGRIQLIPKNWENTYFHWIDQLRDWCISRQLWWGHRIPIWYNKEDPQRVICYDGEGEPEEVKSAPSSWMQDEDVLDTWFSSALWPLSTLGWPEKTAEMQKFYPNSALITGHDILFFWVARMILMGEFAMHFPPFPTVFLHGLIYGKSYWCTLDNGGIAYLSETERREYELGKPIPAEVQSKWEKMSKSKGNIIDPIEIIEEYGTDAMRMALCSSATQSREIDLDRRRFEEFKNFANKIWNGSRFVFMNLMGENPLTAEDVAEGLDEPLFRLEDRWILSRTNHAIKNVNQKLREYLFDHAALEAYDFFWKEFCSYYLEISKPILFNKIGTLADRKNKQKLLAIILCQAIRLIHPMAPFITEELFQMLKEFLKVNSVSAASSDPYTEDMASALQAEACMVAPFPQLIREADLNPEIEERFNLVEKAVYLIRNIRGEMKLPPSTSIDVHIIGSHNDPDFLILRNHSDIIAALIRTAQIQFDQKELDIGFASVGTFNAVKIVIPLPKEFLAEEQTRLLKGKSQLQLLIQKSRAQLANPKFIANAPIELVDKQKNILEQSERDLEEAEQKLKKINNSKSGRMTNGAGS